MDKRGHKAGCIKNGRAKCFLFRTIGDFVQVRYGPCVEISADAPEAGAEAANESEENNDTKATVERILREAQGSRVPLEAVLDALFPPLVWREGGRLFAQASRYMFFL